MGTPARPRLQHGPSNRGRRWDPVPARRDARVPAGLGGGRRQFDALETDPHRPHGRALRGPLKGGRRRAPWAEWTQRAPARSASGCESLTPRSCRARSCELGEPSTRSLCAPRCPRRPPHFLPGRDERGRRPGRPEASPADREMAQGKRGPPGGAAPGAQPHGASEVPPEGRAPRAQREGWHAGPAGGPPEERAPGAQPRGVSGVPPGGARPGSIAGWRSRRARGVPPRTQPQGLAGSPRQGAPPNTVGRMVQLAEGAP